MLAVEVAPMANDTDELRELEQLEGNARLEPLLGSAVYADLRSRLHAQGMGRGRGRAPLRADGYRVTRLW